MAVSCAELGLVLTELKGKSGHGILWAGFVLWEKFLYNIL